MIKPRDGKPCTILVEVTADNSEESQAEIRRSFFFYGSFTKQKKSGKSTNYAG